jgi:hypothetical protein
MTKQLHLAILSLTLIACVENNDTVYIQSPCVEVNVEINQGQDQENNEIESTWTNDLEESTTEDEIVENTPDYQIESEEPVFDEEDLDLHNVSLIIASNNWEGWINGEYISETENAVSELDLELTPGHHVLAIKSIYSSSESNGLMASVEIEGKSYSVTGDGQWLTNDQLPEEGWKLASYDDSNWEESQTCKSYKMWNDEAVSLLEENADQIWYSSDCKRNNDSSWFRLSIIID